MVVRHSSLQWVLAISLILSGGVRVARAAEGTVWQTDFAAAEREAEKVCKPLLVHFHAGWCGPCKKMEKDVFRAADVQEALRKDFVAVKVDADAHPEILARFGIRSLPSDVIVDPQQGRVIHQSEGYVDRAGYLSALARAEGRFERLKAQRFAGANAGSTATSTPNGARPAEANQSPRTAEEPDVVIDLGEPRPLIGLDGFSPVSLARERRWVRGSSQFAWDHEGVTFYMASRQELIEFRTDPHQYAPRLLGCDPVVLRETDRAVSGKTDYAAFYDGELYLFSTGESRSKFKQKPERYTRTQHVLRADQIERQ